MTEVCGNIKTLLADMQGKGLSSTAKLVAILENCGIEDRAELADLLEIGQSTLRTAKSALKNERSKMSGARNQALENEQERSKMSETLENERSNSSALACEDNTTRATKELPSEVLIEDKLELASSREDISETMITDIVSWSHGGDRHTAANWLSSTIKIFGQDATSAAYAKLKTDLLTGSVIARKLPAWTAIAQRMKASPPSTPNVVTFRPATDTSGRPLPSVSEVMAQIRAEAAHAAG